MEKLTKLEYFSAIALQGIIARGNNTASIRELCLVSILYAETLIEELDKLSKIQEVQNEN